MTRSPFSSHVVRQSLGNILTFIQNLLSASILLRLLDIYTSILNWFSLFRNQWAIARWEPTRPYVKYAETKSGIDVTVPVRMFYNCNPVTHSLIYDLEDYLSTWGVEDEVCEIVLSPGILRVTNGELTLHRGDNVTKIENNIIRLS